MTQINATLWVWTPEGWVEPPFGADTARDLKMFNVRGPAGWMIHSEQFFSHGDNPIEASAVLSARKPDWDGGDYWLRHSIWDVPREGWMRLLVLEDRPDPLWRIEHSSVEPFGGYAVAARDYLGAETAFVEDFADMPVPGRHAYMKLERTAVGATEPEVLESYTEEHVMGMFDVFAYTQYLHATYPYQRAGGFGVYDNIDTMVITRIEIAFGFSLGASTDNGPFSEALSEPTFMWSVLPNVPDTDFLAGHAWNAQAPTEVTAWPIGFLQAARSGLTGPMVPSSPGSGTYVFSDSLGWVWAYNGSLSNVGFGAYVSNVPSAFDSWAGYPHPGHLHAWAQTGVSQVRIHYAQPGYTTPEELWWTEGLVE